MFAVLILNVFRVIIHKSQHGYSSTVDSCQVRLLPIELVRT
jgi:hypothetical protein